jgi:hypothetical protein
MDRIIRKTGDIMMDFLDGKKTYSMGIGMILVSLGGYFKGTIDLYSASLGVINGLGFIFLRKGVAKVNGASSVPSSPPSS